VSFGLWAHHMYATGIPLLALSYFAAGSFLIAIPSGVQVFAWIATIWRGRMRWDTPMLWTAGAVFIFVAGGITGVMVASVPFDWQAHDTYFVVAHLHYVLMGGVVFPIFAGIHYWAPKITGRLPSEPWGKVGFWLAFVGMNLTFFIQHFVGLLGMPRRIYTFPAGLDWEIYNLISTIGAVILALGFTVSLGTVLVGYVRGRPAGANPWGAGTLEWAATSPPAGYNFRRVPFVHTIEPLWQQDDIHRAPQEHQALADMLIDIEHPRRELLVTSTYDASPQRVATLPVHSLWPLWTAASIAALLTGALVDQVPLLITGSLLTVVCMLGWGWSRQDVVELSYEQPGGPT
jgi:cytochrome c oxidase subunit I+III